MKDKVQAPTDKEADAAYEQIAEIARAHCLIVSAFGGVMTLAIPTEQRKAGIRARTLNAHAMKEVTS